MSHKKMAISAEQIKELREKTSAGISDIKQALEESGGEIKKALKLIERKLGGKAAKKAERETKAGLVDAYVHGNGRIGSLIEVFCETDFVARNPEFKKFVHDLAMHIAAMQPDYLSFDSIPRAIWNEEKQRFVEEAAKIEKPQQIREEIVEGKLKSHFSVFTLLEQAFIKDQDKKVSDVLNEAIGKFGENIKIGRFARIEF